MQITVACAQRIYSSLWITDASHHSCMIIAAMLLNSAPNKRYNANSLHLTCAPGIMIIHSAFNSKQ